MNRRKKLLAVVAACLALVLLIAAVVTLRHPAAEPKPITISAVTPAPTVEPTAVPTAQPTAVPTAEPTAALTAEPTAAPTAKPTAAPTAEPTAAPTAKPTAAPTAGPTAVPTVRPTAAPTAQPTPTPETVTLSIMCSRALASDALPDGVRAVLPESGVILGDLTVPLQSGDTVWDVLQRVCAEQGIAVESDWTPAYNTAYVRGLGHLYEFDCGRGSGWIYRVNGVVPGVGCSSYTLAAGDRIEWIYTCDFGNDI